MFDDSSIILRIHKFLNELLPFSYFEESDLQQLSKVVEIGVYKKGQIIFKKGQETSSRFYIVKKGAIDIMETQSDLSFLIDKCGEGDMFGIRPILAESNYMYDAISNEDTILYEIPIEKFKEIYTNYEKALNFMIKRFAAGRSFRDDYQSSNDVTSKLLPSLSVRPHIKMQLVTASKDNTLHKVVQKMSENQVSSIIITNSQSFPVGIITDKDIRNIVAQGYEKNVLVSAVMNKPVYCISSDLTVPEIQLEMINSGFHHLCITEDGTDNSKGIAMITVNDLLFTNASDPIVILKNIKKSKSIDDLKSIRAKLDKLLPSFLEEDINRRILLSLIDKLNRSIIQKVVDLSLKAYNASHDPLVYDTFSFFSMGSLARGEQLLMTDQDNGIVFKNDLTHRKNDYLSLGKIINDHLNDIGYEYCPANMMASNPDWCISEKEMIEKTTHWILNADPESVLNTSIFFDFRHEYGNEDIANNIKTHVSNLLKTQDVYIRFSAKQATSNPPPLSFFRKFIIEKDGKHKDLFDIKLRGVSPLSDSARVLALDETWLISSSTIERFEIMKLRDEANIKLYDDAQEAFLFLLSMRLKYALKNKDSGRYLDPTTLSKLDRIHLRNHFHPASRLIDMIERKYKLNYL